MTIEVDHRAFDRVTDEMSRLRQSLSDEHDQVDGRVGDLLGSGWTGDAATQFGQGWSECRSGMQEILSAIELQTNLIRAARAELDRTDGDRAAESVRLTSRLGSL